MYKEEYNIVGTNSLGQEVAIFKAGLTQEDKPTVEIGNNTVTLENVMSNPTGGTAGQVLTKTDSGYSWQNAANPVEANPTLAGGEISLTSIKIGNDKYKIEGGSGTSDPALENAKTTGGIGYKLSNLISLTWDGVLGSRTVYNYDTNKYAVKINDWFPTSFDIINYKKIYFNDAGTEDYNWTKFDIALSPTLYKVCDEDSRDVMIVCTEATTYKDQSYPAGIYFCCNYNSDSATNKFYVCKFECEVITSQSKININYINPTGSTSGQILKSSGSSVSWGNIPVTDVKLDGSSVVNNGIANLTSITDVALESAKSTNGIGYQEVSESLTEIEWDGEIDSRETVEISEAFKFVKLSNNTPINLSQWIGSYIYYTNGEEEEEVIVDDEFFDVTDHYLLSELLLITDGTQTIEGLNFTAGIWAARIETEGTPIHLTYLEYAGLETKKIASSYISSGTETAGKVLTADGSGGVSWQAGGSGGGMYTITATRVSIGETPTWSVDKTPEEALAAYQTYGTNMQVVLKIGDDLVALLPFNLYLHSNPDILGFTLAGVQLDEGTPKCVPYAIAIIEEGEWYVQQYMIK